MRQAGYRRRFRNVCWSGNRHYLPHLQQARKSSRTCFEGPFGELLRATYANPLVRESLGAGGFRFSTKYQDDETDLLYYGYRYYNSSTGGWLSKDPIREPGFRAYALRDFSGETKFVLQLEEDVNPYAFAANDSVNQADLLGLATKKPPTKRPPPKPPAQNPCGNDPVKCMTCMAWGEGRPNDACMKAIAQVIWNRAQGQNKTMCEIVAARGQFDAYDPKPNDKGNVNNGYAECCSDKCKSPYEDARLKRFKEAAAGWPEEFGGGDPQLGGATYFHSGADFPSSWGDRSDYEEIPVPGCSMHFYKKIN